MAQPSDVCLLTVLPASQLGNLSSRTAALGQSTATQSQRGSIVLVKTHKSGTETIKSLLLDLASLNRYCFACNCQMYICTIAQWINRKYAAHNHSQMGSLWPPRYRAAHVLYWNGQRQKWHVGQTDPERATIAPYFSYLSRCVCESCVFHCCTNYTCGCTLMIILQGISQWHNGGKNAWNYWWSRRLGRLMCAEPW